MQEVNGIFYKCERCGIVHEYIDEIFHCKDCGKERCTECANWEDEYCWGCNEFHVSN